MISNKTVEDSGGVIYAFVYSATRRSRPTPAKLHMDLVKAAEVGRISPPVILERAAEGVFLSLNGRIVNPPTSAAVALGARGCLVSRTSEALKGRPHRGGRPLFREAERQEGALLSGNRWFLLLTGERSACPPGTQQLGSNCATLFPYTNIGAVHKTCSPLIAVRQNKNASAPFLSPARPILISDDWLVLSQPQNDLSCSFLAPLTDSFPARCAQTCWDAQKQNSHTKGGFVQRCNDRRSCCPRLCRNPLTYCEYSPVSCF